MEGKIRVFLADPSPLALRMLRRELETAGVEVVGTATDGNEALDSLGAAKPDVLLTDIFLPGMDGFALAEAARGTGEKLPVVFLAAFPAAGLAARAGKCGGSLLPKPCGVHHILRRLRNAVGRVADPIRDAAQEAGPAIAAALGAFGVPSKLIGWEYLAAALARTTGDHHLLDGVTKVLYPEIAREFSTTPAGVERAMRTAIEKAWTPQNESKRRAFFGRDFACSVRTPTNARFLAKMTRAVEAKLAEWERDPPNDPRRFSWLWM